MGCSYEITLLRCNYQMRSPGSLCILPIFGLVNPYVYPTDAVRALKQPTASLAVQYEANTGPVKPTGMGASWTTGHRPKIVGSPFLKAVLIFQPRARRRRTSPKHGKIEQTRSAAIRPV